MSKKLDETIKMVVTETRRGMMRNFRDALESTINDHSPTVSPTHFTVDGTPEEFIDAVIETLNSVE